MFLNSKRNTQIGSNNIYVHDMDVDMEKFKEDYENYDYLQKHLIAEVYFDTDEVLFNSEYRKI